MGTYEIGKFRGHTLWMWNDDIPEDDIDEDMYVNRHDYSVWYKGRQVGYMKNDRSCIEPFNERVYTDFVRYRLDYRGCHNLDFLCPRQVEK